MMPFKRVMVLDFETAWCSSTYTLTKMTTESYIRDPRFKAWGAAYKVLGYTERETKPRWVAGADLQAFFDSVDWSTTKGQTSCAVTASLMNCPTTSQPR